MSREMRSPSRITPETATGTGSLIPGVEVPVPPAVPA